MKVVKHSMINRRKAQAGKTKNPVWKTWGFAAVALVVIFRTIVVPPDCENGEGAVALANLKVDNHPSMNLEGVKKLALANGFKYVDVEEWEFKGEKLFTYKYYNNRRGKEKWEQGNLGGQSFSTTVNARNVVAVIHVPLGELATSHLKWCQLDWSDSKKAEKKMSEDSAGLIKQILAKNPTWLKPSLDRVFGDESKVVVAKLKQISHANKEMLRNMYSNPYVKFQGFYLWITEFKVGHKNVRINFMSGKVAKALMSVS